MPPAVLERPERDTKGVLLDGEAKGEGSFLKKGDVRDEPQKPAIARRGVAHTDQTTTCRIGPFVNRPDGPLLSV
jgi:hypothetical protein